MEIGNALRLLRTTRKMTLKELAEKSGVQIATLSRMEHGIMTGTLHSHMNITRALGTSLADFYREIENEHKAVAFIGRGEKHEPLVRSKESSIELLTTRLAGKKMMPVLIRLKGNAQTAEEQCPPNTEKFLYLLEGKIRACIGKEEYNLVRGDSMYFDASLPHFFNNTAAPEALALCVITPSEIKI